METIVIHPQNENQQKALQIILEGFQIPYDQEPVTDETDRILANPATTKRLNDSIRNIEKGNTISVKLEDLWK